ncbi:Dual specificity phosphatase, catalytic domain containing protein [Trichomonas vaginalis G3]|uniref:Dual specificity phosphatase, catalytic domain containing protein n=1 Tax=Trichomonas vaginalis (strain ATCC PRA-98 / G3) TaxID=412133 RepID=A2E6H4_TRIV3|nr:protein tyrosine/serine/threonine phosphatase protein [Trichomonas vaginalis G3]EAY11787.1 Dual specificity phosphatase, catalytic domain containing protein [Trichomonas vaginalis G3]KAI5540656.1 protein tyrosine/serine/threonine phosphatase protein [Trichomonas vaginalis G3]|eukprot:XP_001324010.1 Dual specificity phosphatase, catalytic domain containing protein [Trichomonas vaginalis G3]
MGQGFSNDISAGEPSSGQKALTIFTMSDGVLSPIPAVVFFRNPSSFMSDPIILMEPPNREIPRKGEYIYPKVSYVETVRHLHQYFRTSVINSTDNIKIWIFTPISQNSDERNEMMHIVKSIKFHIYSSNVVIALESIFSESVLPKSISEAFKRTPAAARTRELLNFQGLRYAPIQLSLDTNSQESYTPPSSPLFGSSVFKDTVDFVMDGLYISGEMCSSDLKLLQNFQITHIVNMNAKQSPTSFPDKFIYFNVHIIDSVFETLTDEFWEAVKFTDEAIKSGGKVLVHCRKGISRSAALCFAFLLRYRGYQPDDAIKLIQKARPMISINDGFMKQILEYHKKFPTK